MRRQVQAGDDCLFYWLQGAPRDKYWSTSSSSSSIPCLSPRYSSGYSSSFAHHASCFSIHPHHGPRLPLRPPPPRQLPPFGLCCRQLFLLLSLLFHFLALLFPLWLLRQRHPLLRWRLQSSRFQDCDGLSAHASVCGPQRDPHAKRLQRYLPLCPRVAIRRECQPGPLHT